MYRQGNFIIQADAHSVFPFLSPFWILSLVYTYSTRGWDLSLVKFSQQVLLPGGLHACELDYLNIYVFIYDLNYHL